MSSSMSRRGFVAAGSASLVSAGRSGCCHIRTGLLPSAASPPALFPHLTGRLAIDVHTHMFNGNDLQVAKFIKWNPDIGSNETLRQIAGEIVQALTWSLAPTGCDEYSMQASIAAGRAPAPSDEASLKPYQDRGFKRFQTEMRKTPAYKEGQSAEQNNRADERSRYLKAVRTLVDSNSYQDSQKVAKALGTPTISA